MSILSVENIHKSYGEKVLFDHLSFTIAEKQRIGLIGVNGTGKSTLLKIIAGLESAESGKVVHANQFHIEYLSQYPEFQEDKTVLEQIYYGDSQLMEATAAKTVLTRLGITNFQQPMGELSGGQKKRVAIARALIQPADLLILDEPTNHLDNQIIDWLEEFLAQYKGALLIVTHDRYFLNRVTNRIFELDQGRIFIYEGNYETFLEKKAEREEQELASEDKRQNILRRELAWLKRGAKARTTKQKARIQRVEELQGQQKTVSNERLDIAIGANRLGKKVLELQGISKAYGEKKLISHFNYLVVPNERLGIIGPNGTGKTTLMNIMAGLVEPDQGVVEVGQTVKIGYYTQECQDMNSELRVIEYIKEAAEVVRTIDGQVITAAQMLERFLFSKSMQWTYIYKLSGGERRRLYLLRVLMAEPNVLFLDEPTNDLDTKTLSILEDYLETFPGVVITVSHDRYFLDRVVDHLIVFTGQPGEISLFQGDYSEYLELAKEEKAAKDKESSRTETKIKGTEVGAQQKKERPKKLSYKEQREWEGIEDKIAGLEEQLGQLKGELALAASDFERLQLLLAEQQQLEEELEAAIQRWTELSLLVEELGQTK